MLLLLVLGDETRPNLPRFSDNEDFLKSLATFTKKAKCKLTVCPEEENQDDQWMQVCGPICLRPRSRLMQALGSWGSFEGTLPGMDWEEGASEGPHAGGLI